jgi:hypothetical protein
LDHGLGRIEERVTNGTMARSSARRSIKRKKAGGHYAADLVLQLPARGSGSVTLHSVLPSCWIDAGHSRAIPDEFRELAEKDL